MRGAFAVGGLLVLLIASSAHADHVDPGEIQWACGFGGGHPSQCGIDPVGGDDQVDSRGDPEFKAAGDDDWIPDDARVLGIDHNGDARAYPVRMLNAHEIVNDIVGGDRLAITFCPLCGSGVSFLREFEYEGRTIETNFTASGYLWSTDMVMWDPVTGQLWNQISGRPIAWLDDGSPNGRGHADIQLELVPTTVTTWGQWKDTHTDTLLLQPVFGASSYQENAYTVTEPDNCDHGLSGEHDCDVDGIHPKEQMVAYDDGEGGVAFPIRWVAAEPGSTATYTTDEGRTFVATADAGGGAQIQDAATGETLPTTHMFWFAWHDHMPDTEVWLPDDHGGASPTGGDPAAEDDNLAMRIGVTAAISALALAFILWSSRQS